MLGVFWPTGNPSREILDHRCSGRYNFGWKQLNEGLAKVLFESFWPWLPWCPANALKIPQWQVDNRRICLPARLNRAYYVQDASSWHEVA